MAVTNRRIIIDDEKAPQGVQSMQNADVSKVLFKKRTQKNNVTTITLDKVETASGGTVKVNLRGIPSTREDQLNEIFPNATIELAKGASKGVIIVVGVLAALIALCCIIFVLSPLLFNK